MHPHGLALNFLPHKFFHRSIISTCSTHSKMAPLLNYFFEFLVDSVISLTKNEKYPNRLFHIMAENEKPIGYFTEFVNSDISHQCQFAYLPPTLLD
jgi:hypothetical protein